MPPARQMAHWVTTYSTPGAMRNPTRAPARSAVPASAKRCRALRRDRASRSPYVCVEPPADTAGLPDHAGGGRKSVGTVKPGRGGRRV